MLNFPGSGYIAGNLKPEDALCRIFAAKDAPCRRQRRVSARSPRAARRHHRRRREIRHLGIFCLILYTFELGSNSFSNPARLARTPLASARMPRRQSSAAPFRVHSSPHKSLTISWSPATPPQSPAASCCSPSPCAGEYNGRHADKYTA
jgi:hypothetical protein